MRIELLGHAPDQASMWAYLKDMGWAKKDKEGVWSSISCNLSQIGPVVEADKDGVETKRVDGLPFNLRIYGDVADAMVATRPQTKVVDGDTVQEDFWKRTNFKAEVEKQMVRSQTLKTAVKDGLPAGYEDSTHKVRIYPADKINKRKNVWA